MNAELEALKKEYDKLAARLVTAYRHIDDLSDLLTRAFFELNTDSQRCNVKLKELGLEHLPKKGASIR